MKKKFLTVLLMFFIIVLLFGCSATTFNGVTRRNLRFSKNFNFVNMPTPSYYNNDGETTVVIICSYLKNISETTKNNVKVVLYSTIDDVTFVSGSQIFKKIQSQEVVYVSFALIFYSSEGTTHTWRIEKA